MIPWTEKYRAKTFGEVVGQSEAVLKIKNFLENWGKKKAIILHGPPGVGKTTLAHVAARETGAEIFELNASDLRNKSKLQEILKPAIEQQSLIHSGKIILVDEVDGICRRDYGGLAELTRIIASTNYPIFITANDIWDSKFSDLRKKCEVVEVKEFGYSVIKNVVIDILRKEKLFFDIDIITRLAINAKGDLRAAINDLQMLAQSENPEKVVFDERNKATDIFKSLRKVFKEVPTNETLGVFDSVDMNLDEILLWVEENVPEEYKDEELARACILLAKTDVFRRRIYRQQYWRFLVYENIFLSYGISSAKKFPKTGFTKYKRPTRILKIWLNNQKTMKKKSIAKKYAEYAHVSHKRALNEFGLIKQILKSNPESHRELKLDKGEVEYLLK